MGANDVEDCLFIPALLHWAATNCPCSDDSRARADLGLVRRLLQAKPDAREQLRAQLCRLPTVAIHGQVHDALSELGHQRGVLLPGIALPRRAAVGTCAESIYQVSAVLDEPEDDWELTGNIYFEATTKRNHKSSRLSFHFLDALLDHAAALR